MAIAIMKTLTQPKGTDVYNVAVFNANAQAIQDAINGTEQAEGIIPDVNSLLMDIVKKYPYFSEQTNVDTVLEDGVYYNIVSNSKVLTNNILFSIGKTIGNTIQTMISREGIISQRNVTASAVSSWTVLTTKVIDNLTTGGSQNALSAEQGKILDQTKLNRFTKTESLNIDSIVEGIYICSAGITSVVSQIPSSASQLIVIQYGNGISMPSIQIVYSSGSGNSFYIRYYTETQAIWSWSDWYSVGDSGAESPIFLDTSPDYK